MIASIPPALCFALAVAAALPAVYLLRRRTPDGRAVFDGALLAFVQWCLWLRYRIRVSGLADVARRGTRGILFLPNHPSLIEPILVAVVLRRTFRPRPLADERQTDRFFIRWLAQRIGALRIPDPGRTRAAGRERIRAALQQIVAALRRGENIHLYPSGRVYRNQLEDLAANSAVQTILRRHRAARVVLVRTRGLWGSSFSWASGREPNVAKALGRGVGSLLVSGLFFAPRREVTIELHEPPDLPRTARRAVLNQFLEDFYNEDAPPNTHVPRTIWTDGPPRQRPEPTVRATRVGAISVPPATRRIVADHLRDLTGARTLRDEDELARDLGLDSLALAELVAWLEGEFGFPQAGIESLRTVGDVLLAACGEVVAAEAAELRPIRRKWFAQDPQRPQAVVPEGSTLPEVFLNQAALGPGRIIAADQARGEKSYRDLITAVYVLRPILEALPGPRVGIMLPATVTADTLYLAALFAGKTPVMVNWTAGPRNVRHALDLVECEHVLTARALLDRLAQQGIDLSGLSDRFVLLEPLAEGISTTAKLKAAARSRLGWSALRDAEVSRTAAILFTSGSESLPKAVPLTHENILTNIRDAVSVFRVYTNDRLMGMLPPFHSLGLTAGVALPLCLGVKVVHHPNPTDGRTLGRLIEAYRTTILLGTPTFLHGIVRASAPGQLATLRLCVTGAEKCPDRVYQAIARRRPDMTILEGYGVTECSPIVSVNDETDPRPGTIGKVLPSLAYAVVDVDTGRRVEPGTQGMLLVRGASVFGGYLKYDGEPPFVEMDGERWYRTGDLVTEDADGVLTFRGRLKRFIKLGGEMISLPAIEAVLEPHFRDVLARAVGTEAAEEGPVLAVEATAHEDHPELVLFTCVDADRETVNRLIRESGLSALHNIRRVVRVDEIPKLGTGKTDYRALAARLEDPPPADGPSGAEGAGPGHA